MENNTNNYSEGLGVGLVEQVDKGSFLKGIVGGLLGALAGGVLWFATAAFVNFVSAYVGFFTAIFATWGYKKLNGRRSTGFAVTYILLISIIVLLLAQFGAYYYQLSTDAEIKEFAASISMPAGKLALLYLGDPGFLRAILPEVLKCMGLGILGVLFSIGSIKRYCKLGQEAKLLPVDEAANETLPEGTEPPERFTVRERKVTRVMLKVLGIVVLVCMTVFELVMAMVCFDPADMQPDAFLFCTLVFAVFMFLAIYVLRAARRHIIVEGENITYQPAFGKARSYKSSDIARIRGRALGNRKLYDHNGKLIMRYETNQEDHALLTAYLAKRGITRG